MNDEKIYRQLLAAGVAACLNKPVPATQLRRISHKLLVENRQNFAQE
jgi:hypothetical protein